MENIQEWCKNLIRFINDQPKIVQITLDLDHITDPEVLTWAVALLRTYDSDVIIKFIRSSHAS